MTTEAITPVRNWLLPALAGLGIALSLIAPVPDGWTPEAMRAAALTLATIVFWATGLWPIGITAIAFLLSAALFSGQGTGVVFSGFLSGAIWLVFAGLVIGEAVKHTGLGERLARAMVGALGGSYLGALSGVAIAGMALAFVMPSSMGRIVLLVPLVLAMAEGLGFAAGSRGRSGMIMVAAIISFTPGGTILPSLVPGMILAGAADTIYGITMTYGGFLKVHFPVMGFARAVLVVGLVWLMFNDTPGARPTNTQGTSMGRGERMMAVVLVVALTLWATDTWHGIPAAWIGLGAALIALIPDFRLVPPKTLNERLDYSSVFYVAAVLGMGAIIAASGLADNIGRMVFSALPLDPAAKAGNFAGLSMVSMVVGLAVTNPGVPAVLSPFAGELAGLTGMSVEAVLMTQVVGFTGIILPYQAAPVMIGLRMGGVPLGQATRMTVITSAITLVVLLPVEYLWWQFIGLI